MEAASDHTCMPTLPQYCTSHSQRPPFPHGSGCLPIICGCSLFPTFHNQWAPSNTYSSVSNPFCRLSVRDIITPQPDLTAPGRSPGLTCRQNDASHTALAEAELLNNVVKMGWEEGESHVLFLWLST